MPRLSQHGQLLCLSGTRSRRPRLTSTDPSHPSTKNIPTMRSTRTTRNTSTLFQVRRWRVCQGRPLCSSFPPWFNWVIIVGCIRVVSCWCYFDCLLPRFLKLMFFPLNAHILQWSIYLPTHSCYFIVSIVALLIFWVSLIILRLFSSDCVAIQSI